MSAQNPHAGSYGLALDDVGQIAVIGAGTMGHGIAQVAAAAGFEVTLYDVAEDAVDAGLERIARNLEKGVARGKVDADSVPGTLGRISGTIELPAAVADADVVIEAAPERLELKQTLFAQLAEHAPRHALLATNTSSFSIATIGAAAAAVEADAAARVIGLHFFNPVHIMALLEIVVGADTAPGATALARGLAQRLGKTAIVVKDSPGFATSRLGIALAMEAIRMLEEGVASAADIDTAMELGYRHPMGPLRLTDLVGLDVRLDITRYLHENLGAESFRPPALLEKMVAEGRLGRKSGRGFYDYD